MSTAIKALYFLLQHCIYLQVFTINSSNTRRKQHACTSLKVFLLKQLAHDFRKRPTVLIKILGTTDLGYYDIFNFYWLKNVYATLY